MKDQCPDIDINYTRCCIIANIKNSVTAHYFLLVKNKGLNNHSSYQNDNEGNI